MVLATKEDPMANKRHKLEEIVTKLRQVEVLRGQGVPMADVVHSNRGAQLHAC